MKARLLFCLLLATLQVPSRAQDGPFVVERGPHHNKVQRVVHDRDPAGNPISITNNWIQIEDGLNYWSTDQQAWTEARAEIELTPTGAIARHGQHRVIFSSNVNDPEGAVDVEVHHQVRLRSSVLAISCFDPVDGAEADRR